MPWYGRQFKFEFVFYIYMILLCHVVKKEFQIGNIYDLFLNDIGKLELILYLFSNVLVCVKNQWIFIRFPLQMNYIHTHLKLIYNFSFQITL